MSRPGAAVHRPFVAGLALVALVLATWWGTVRVPFVFDDVPAIVRNESLRTLWPPDANLWSAPQSPLAGRPVAAFTFAVDHALGGLSPYGYHVVNLALHALTTCLVFGLLRRTLAALSASPRAALGTSFVTAALWSVHPLQSEALSYVTQRTELLACFFIVATLYCARRGFDAVRRGGWFALAVLCSVLAMGSKEMAVGAPLLVLLYDRTFVSGRVGTALSRHGRLHGGLFLSWIVLAALVVQEPRSASAGFEHGISPYTWLITQAGVLTHQLGLAIRPVDLTLSYEWPLAASAADVWPSLLVLLALFGATCIAVARRSPWGVVGALFFVILAPTSSVLPIPTEVAAERRMYLPLLAVLVLLVVTGARLLRSWPTTVRTVLASVLVLGAAALSRERVTVWQDPVALWEDAVRVRPENGFAHFMLGNARRDAGRLDAARDAFERAHSLDPGTIIYLVNLGNVWIDLGRYERAVDVHEQAVALAPDDPFARHNLAVALLMSRRRADALPHLRRCVELVPDEPEFRCNLAAALLAQGQDFAEARRHAEVALSLEPGGSRAQAILSALREAERDGMGYSPDG